MLIERACRRIRASSLAAKLEESIGDRQLKISRSGGILPPCGSMDSAARCRRYTCTVAFEADSRSNSMSDSNPFEAPSSEADIPDRDIRRAQRLIRVILAVHLLGIIGTRGVVRADIMGQTKSNLVTLFQSEPAQVVILLTAWSPLVMAFAIGWRKEISLSQRIGFVAFDVILSMIQLWMMLPLVS